MIMDVPLLRFLWRLFSGPRARKGFRLVRFRQSKKLSLIILLAALLGGGLGIVTRHYWLEYNEREQREYRSRLAAERLAESPELQVGKTIGNWQFETLVGDTVELYASVKGPGILVVIHPECSSCIDEIIRLKISQISVSGLKRLAFISYGNPRLLQDLWGDLGVDFTVLYDHHAEWCKRNSVQDFPLLIKFDGTFVVEEILVGGLLDDDFAFLCQ